MSSEKIRAEFEAWYMDEQYKMFLSSEMQSSDIFRDCKEVMWVGWQASRAALPVWQPMDTCPKHVDVLFYREDCGVINGQFTCADSFMTDKERESGDYSEDEQFSEDAWCYGPQGVERLDGELVPTHWMPYPAEPEVKP